MTLQLWLTTVVAIVGQIVTVANGIAVAQMSARNANRLAIHTRELDRRGARRAELEDLCDRFLVAARRLTDPDAGDTEESLRDLRTVTVRIERMLPAIAGSALAARRGLAGLVMLRSEGMWSEAVAQATAESEVAVAAVRDALIAELGRTDM